MFRWLDSLQHVDVKFSIARRPIAVAVGATIDGWLKLKVYISRIGNEFMNWTQQLARVSFDLISAKSHEVRPQSLHSWQGAFYCRGGEQSRFTIGGLDPQLQICGSPRNPGFPGHQVRGPRQVDPPPLVSSPPCDAAHHGATPLRAT
jgi:hypothetical protein